MMKSRLSHLYLSSLLSITAAACVVACASREEPPQEDEEGDDSQQDSKDGDDDTKDSKDDDDAKDSKDGDDEDTQTPSDDDSSPKDEDPSSEDEDPKDDSDDEGSDESGGDDSNDKEEEKDPMPWFTFFTTSQEGLVELSDDKVNGFGGDLGGLKGADEICKKLALRGNPGDKKTWRAFLSAHKGEDGQPVHAIDRIGPGPWHDFNKRLLAKTKEELLPGSDRRPAGADPQLAEMFTDELGQPISPDTNVVDNHDMLTGSDKNGRLPDSSTPAETCNDWTSKDTNLGKPRIGHAWPRSRRSGREWIYDHRAGGCGAGIDTEKKKGNGTPTVGSGGGYGGIYCFALNEEASSD